MLTQAVRPPYPDEALARWAAVLSSDGLFIGHEIIIEQSADESDVPHREVTLIQDVRGDAFKAVFVKPHPVGALVSVCGPS